MFKNMNRMKGQIVGQTIRQIVGHHKINPFVCKNIWTKYLDIAQSSKYQCPIFIFFVQ